MTAGQVGPRVRLGVLGYGSILVPEEIDEVLTRRDGRIEPVRVRGFKRVFNQEASWRDVEGPRRGVLNAVRAEDEWCNAVLLADLDREEYRRYRERERGYRLVEVARDAIEPYQTGVASTLDDLDLVLIATGEKVRRDIEPIEEYLDLCLDGARSWGVAFEEDFLRTTELATGEALLSHRQRR